MRCALKGKKLLTSQIDFICKRHGFPFKVTPLKSDVLSHPSLLHFYALLDGFFILMASMPSK